MAGRRFPNGDASSRGDGRMRSGDCCKYGGCAMALAKRGTRRITVDNRAYRWVVAPDDGYMVLVVEDANTPGQRLEAFFGYQDV